MTKQPMQAPASLFQSEFNGWGSAFQFGKLAQQRGQQQLRLFNIEVDSCTSSRRPRVARGQVGFGTQKQAAFSGRDAGRSATRPRGLQGHAALQDDGRAGGRHRQRQGTAAASSASVSSATALHLHARFGVNVASGPGARRQADDGTWAVNNPRSSGCEPLLRWRCARALRAHAERCHLEG